jgi:hypothetical protein
VRTLTDHIVEGDSANHQLTITVTDEPGAGGANHRYVIDGFVDGPLHQPDRPSETGGEKRRIRGSAGRIARGVEGTHQK